MKKKILALAAATVLCMLCLAGCGADSDSDTDKDKNSNDFTGLWEESTDVRKDLVMCINIDPDGTVYMTYATTSGPESFGEGEWTIEEDSVHMIVTLKDVPGEFRYIGTLEDGKMRVTCEATEYDRLFDPVEAVAY